MLASRSYLDKNRGLSPIYQSEKTVFVHVCTSSMLQSHTVVNLLLAVPVAVQGPIDTDRSGNRQRLCRNGKDA